MTSVRPSRWFAYADIKIEAGKKKMSISYDAYFMRYCEHVHIEKLKLIKKNVYFIGTHIMR